MGGKARLAGKFAPILQESIDQTDGFLEPFVGGFNVAPKLRLKRAVFRDLHSGLIEMYRALQDGWKPPDSVSAETYYEMKRQGRTDPISTFVSFACSYGGKEWDGYARDANGTNYAAQGSRSLLASFPISYNAEFQYGSYQEATPPNGSQWTIYADPPYLGKKQYRGRMRNFDSPAFFTWCESMASAGHHHVFVSEFSAPEHWDVVWEKERVENLSGRSQKRVERLYRVPVCGPKSLGRLSPNSSS